MSEVFSPTAEQREAIAARGSALLISAGAGSGKTRVLTERLMAYLTDERDPRDADEFLIITYTRAAAGELRGRIISAISDRLRADPKNRRMRRQAVLAHRAEIDTIHSFCGRIARENAHSLSISPAFRIAEESECEAIKTATLERVLEARYENIDRHEGFSLLADTLSPGRDDKKLAELTLEVYTKLRSNVDEQHRAEEQLERLRRAATEDLSKTVWGGFIIEKARRIAEYRLSRAEKTLELLAADGEAYRLFGECFEYARTCARAFLASTEPSADGSAPSDIWDAAEKSAVFEFPRAKPCKKGTFEDIKAEWTRCREGLREIRDLFPADSQGLKEDIAAVYPVTAALFALVRDFAGAYLDEKQRRGIVDFSDLEHFALQLLCDKEGSPTELAREISARYVEIMVDEYQDVSEIQERIFEAVSRGGRNLVTVGDARQSIYRFRLADPSIFLRKYRSFSDAADEGSESSGRRVLLSRNFRSRGAIIDAVNYVFSLVMSREFGELDYTPREYLVTGPDRDGGAPVELDILTSAALPEDASDDADAKREDKHRYEARFIAARAKELVEGGFIIPDGGAGRRAEYSDIAILLRARTHATVYREELTRLGIPVESPDSEVFFDRPEIETALAFLSVIDNPRDDTALIAVLRSPVYAFTPDELAEIRLALPDGDFYDALEKHAATDEKSQNFITELAGLRTLAPELGAERALWLLYNKTELPAYISAESDGAARRGGLMGLIERARQASSIGRRSVFDFLRFVKSLRERGSDIAAGSPVSGSGGGAVRLMTAHKSKGLEFPIVFLADMSKRFNFTDSRERLLFHRELGAGPKRVDLERRVEYPTLPRIAIAKKLADETMSEEMRVLYVAMTRAREKLIITYASDDAEKTLEKLAFDAPERAEPISPYMLSRQRGTGDILLLAALTRPETRAILAEAPFDNPPRGEGAWDVRIVRMSTNDAANDAAEAADTADAADNERSVQPEEAATEQDVPPPFTYPYPRAPELPSKLTVTELKNRASDSDLLTDAQQIEYTPPHGVTSGGTYSRPGFISPKGALTGAERGTALHLAMRRMALREYSDADEVRRELDSITAAGYLTPQQRAVVEEAKILRFLRSEYGARAARAAEVFREFKFSLFVPAEAYFPGGGADEIMLQGIVDLAFREGDKIIVVDFKTDRLRSDAALREKTALYTPQVRAYMSAMERVTGLAAREGVIYFFDGGAAVPV